MRIDALRKEVINRGLLPLLVSIARGKVGAESEELAENALDVLVVLADKGNAHIYALPMFYRRY
jgi:hypothetical protein